MRFAEFLTDQKLVRPQKFVNKPLVSVIMPTYCRAHDGLLARAITSVLAQTFMDFEFIIVDDGSTDGSEDIIREFQNQDYRILYVRHEVNSGLPALRVDEGILLSRGDYIAFGFDDDEWMPLFLETVTAEAIEQNKSFVHCQAEYLLAEQAYRCPFPVTQPTYASLLQGNKIANVSVLLHRSTLMAGGLYDPHVIMRRTTDWDLWLRIAQNEPPHLVPEVLVRAHGGLPDAIWVQTPWLEFEDYALVMLLSRNADLVPERILNYDVIALDRYVGSLPRETMGRFYRYLVLPWLGEHKGQIEKLGIPIEEALDIQQTAQKYNIQQSRITLLRERFLARIEQKYSTRRSRITLLKEVFLIITVKITLKIMLLKERLLARRCIWDTIPPSFQKLTDDPAIGDYRRNGFSLQESPNLQHFPFQSYPLTVEGGSLCAILLGLSVGAPKVSGVVRVDIVSAENEIVTASWIPTVCMAKDEPTEFFLEPPVKPGNYRLRIFGKNLSAPVHVFEFRKYSGLTGIVRKPLCGQKLA